MHHPLSLPIINNAIKKENIREFESGDSSHEYISLRMCVHNKILLKKTSIIFNHYNHIQKINLILIWKSVNDDCMREWTYEWNNCLKRMLLLEKYKESTNFI